MNLGYHLAEREHRVLLIDLDPQSSLTTFMGLEPLEIEKTLYEALLEDEPLPIHTNIHGVDLAPANINLSGAELELVTADMREQRMKDAIAPEAPFEKCDRVSDYRTAWAYFEALGAD